MKVACPSPLVVAVAVGEPPTTMVEWPEPCDSVTVFAVVTGLLSVFFRATVICDVFTPSAATVAVPATTVELPADVAVTGGAEPSPGFRPASDPLPKSDC